MVFHCSVAQMPPKPPGSGGTPPGATREPTTPRPVERAPKHTTLLGWAVRSARGPVGSSRQMAEWMEPVASPPSRRAWGLLGGAWWAW